MQRLLPPFKSIGVFVTSGLLACSITLANVLPAAASSYSQGVADVKRGYIQRAIPQLQQATRQSPRNAAAWWWLGQAHEKQGGAANIKKAIAAYQRVLALEPNHIQTLQALGTLLSWQDDTRSEATALLNRAHKLSPANLAVQKQLVELYTWQGQEAQAYALAVPIAARFKQDKNWMAIYAHLLARQGNAQAGNQAVQIYETLLNIKNTPDFLLQAQYAEALRVSDLPDAPQKIDSIYHSLNERLAKMPVDSHMLERLAFANLAYQLGRYNDSLATDLALPKTLQSENPVVQRRIARAQIKSALTSLSPEASTEAAELAQLQPGLDKFYALYQANQLSLSEQLEYLDYLIDAVKLGQAELPEPGFIETLTKAALAQTQPGSTEAIAIALRRARYGSYAGDAFEAVNAGYWQAIQRLKSDPDAAKTLDPLKKLNVEYADYLQASAAEAPDEAIAQYSQWLKLYPNNAKPAWLVGRFAEVLSWQPDYRTEALKQFWALWQADADHRAQWREHLAETLGWHQPKPELVSLYDAMLADMPTLWQARLSKARALRKQDYAGALALYSQLIQDQPTNAEIQSEWAGLLLSDADHRDEALAALKPLVQNNPENLPLAITYAKLLSYKRHYGQAIDRFEDVLKSQPDNLDAWVGLGYAQLWSGRPLAAKETFKQAYATHAENQDVLLGLAEAEKALGRNDNALRWLELYDAQKTPQKSSHTGVNGFNTDYRDSRAIRPVSNWVLRSPKLVYDFSVLPAESRLIDSDNSNDARQSVPDVLTLAVVAAGDTTGFDVAPGRPALKPVSDDLDALKSSLEALEALQARSQQTLNDLDASLSSVETAAPEARAIGQQMPVMANVQLAPSAADQAYLEQVAQTEQSMFGSASASEQAESPAMAFTTPILQGLDTTLSRGGFAGRDALSADSASGRLSARINRDLRPTLRSGFYYTVQDGDPSTNRLRSYGFANLLSFYLTPQLQLRAGLTPRKLWQPRVDTDPNETTASQYNVGATWQPTDRLVLDGDLALTHLSQTRNEDLTFQASAAYKWTDRIRTKVGAWRLPNENSLLAFGGIRPNFGAYQGQVVGQAREHVLYAELNTLLTSRVDWNTQYQWGFVSAENAPTSFKNQIYSSIGYTQPLGNNHSARLAYELLWFSYSRNATFGFVDLVNGTAGPQVTLAPPIAASQPAILGGYFSPAWFVQNAIRLDLKGSFYDQLLEYRLGGSLGVQAYHNGQGFNEGSATTLATTVDGILTYNATDWLSVYGNFALLDSGGSFNRWLVGGGMILRPYLPALMPVIK
ncbi:MAG: tetratricopeptide repeat protein [Vampirovibrionales bacterium]|nr:tetratricopeptide repeat protein [Vampirovibrionales bacterium]